MAIEFEDGNPNASESNNFATTMFMGFVAQIEQQNPDEARDLLHISTGTAEGFCRIYSLGEAAKKDLIMTLNTFYYSGLIAGVKSRSQG
jgi:hypothetical protein